MKLKYSLSLVLVLMLCITANAYDAKIDGIYYSFSGTNATVTSTSNGLGSSDYSDIVVIPESVTYNGTTYSVISIGSKAFYDCSGLTSITIPNGMITIGRQAFRGCKGLTSVTIPSSVYSIDQDAFAKCYFLASNIINYSPHLSNESPWGATLCDEETSDGLLIKDNSIVNCRSWATSVTIPNGVKSIGDNAFRDCSNLTSITIPGSVSSICGSAFSGCSSLTSVTIFYGVTGIGGSAFYNCSSLTSVIIPNSVTSIGYGAFQGCSSLTSVTIPSSMTSIGNGAFYNCSGLTSVTIPNSVTSIAGTSFYGCSNLTSVTIPNSVTSIGNSAFSGCSNLTSVKVDIETPVSISIGSTTFPNRANATLIVPAGSKSAYEKANYWKEFKEIIEAEAPSPAITFDDANVKALCVANWDTNHDGELSETEAAAVTDLGEVFKGNKTITSFNELQYFTGLTSIAANAFSGCSGLTFITLNEGLTTIWDNAFKGCTSLTEIILPSTVNSLHAHAFMYCNNLSTVTILGKLEHFSNVAFQSCYPNLATINYEETNSLNAVDGVYQISTAEDLYNFAILSTVSNCTLNACLTADIDYTDYSYGSNWYPIGMNVYRGTFDGQGHTITIDVNNEWNSWDEYGVALFSHLGSNGIIKNLRVEGRVRSCAKYASGILNILNGGIVSHCVSDVDIISTIDGDCTNGGIAGLGYHDFGMSTVEYCVVAGSFQGSNAHHRGGIIGIGCNGNSENITIDNCLFVANVDDLNVTESNTFVRDPISSTHITNCYYLNALGDASAGTQVSATQLTSGELCYLLNGDQSSINWTQNLTGNAVDSYPLPFSTHAQVYVNSNNYSNVEEKNYLLMADTEGIVGGKTTIKVDLRNEDVIGGVQFKVKLPTGMSINTNNNGLKVLGTSRTSGLTVVASYNEQGDYYQVLIYGVGSSITGTSGTIVTLDVSISDALALGNYEVDIYDIAITDVQERLTYPSNVKGTLQLINPKSGDANRDGIINVADIICIANHILGSAPASFDANAANVNGDAVINVADIIKLANMILSGNGASVKEFIFENGLDPE